MTSAVRTRVWSDWALAVLVAASVFVAALPASRAYQAPGSAPVLALAAALPVAIAFGCARLLRWPAPASYAVSLVGLSGLLLVAGGFHAGSTYRYLVDGPNRVLTETLPLSGGLAALGPLVVLAWVAAAAAGELLGRARTDGGSAPRSPLALPLVMFVVCYGVAVSAPHPDNAAGPVLLVLLAGGAAVRSVGAGTIQTAQTAEADGRPPRRWRPFATAMAAAGGVTVALWALAPQVPAFSGQPAALHRTPPTASPVVTDPLDALAQLRDGTAGSPARPVLSVDTSAPSSGYLTLAVLDSYDGGSWRFDATFHPTGGRIPGAAASLGTTEVRQQIEELAALPVPLLPELDRPRFVSGPAVATDPATGMLVPESHTVVGTPYTVVSESPGSTLTQLPAADELGGSAATAADELGGSAAPADTTLPPDTTPAVATTVRFLAALTGMRPAPTVAFLDAAISALHQSTRRIDPRLAPANPTGGQPSHLGGTSLSEVINAVTVNRAATPEQFATFAAMAARYLGVPARVVTGFRIPATSSGHLVPAGRYRVTNRQAWAWIEVPVAGLGWVVADPTPDVTTGAATPPPEAVQAPATTLPPRQANAVPRASILGGHALAPSARVRVPHPHPVPLWLVVGLIAIAAVLAGLAAGPGQAAARRWGRRRARRSADPSELAVGAWLELLDGLSRAGLRPEPGSTGRDVAAEAAGSFGPDLRDPVAEVGRVAEQAVFSVSRPPDADAALRAWDLQQSVGRQLRRGLSRRDRVRASVLVGSTPRRPAGR